MTHYNSNVLADDWCGNLEEDTDCMYYASIGDCENGTEYTDWMARNCKEACGFCQTNGTGILQSAHFIHILDFLFGFLLPDSDEEY